MAASPLDSVGNPIGDAARRVRRAKLFIFLAIRSVHVAQGFVSAIGGQTSFRSRKWANATLALTTVETAWAAERQWRASQNLASVALVDAATSVVGMGMIGAATDPTSRTTSLNWMLPYGVGSTVGLAFALPRRQGALFSAAMAGAYLYTTRESFARRGEATTAVSNALSFVGFHLIVSVLSDITERFADEVDQARRVAVESGQALATEQERNRQHRLLHDSVLQTLEAFASGRVDDPAVIRARAREEGRRLRADLQPRTTPDDLVAALAELIGETEPRLELHVELVAPEHAVDVDPVATAALVDATREALTNVAKHSGANRAVLRVRRVGGRIEVIVRDEGDGFDQASTLAGFGTSQSITMRMHEAGGGAEVRSAPGGGTRVRSSLGSGSMTTVVVIEDHPLMRKGIAEVIERDDELDLVAVFDSIERYDVAAPVAELCVLDLHLPGLQGAPAVAHVVGRGLRVLVLSAAVARTDVVDALSAGALGYVAKDADEGEIRRALHTVAAGHSYVAPTLASQLLEIETSAPELTPREREVLELVAEGASDKTIARELGLSVNTVHSHLDRIRDKTGRRRRAELARLAVDLGVTKRE